MTPTIGRIVHLYPGPNANHLHANGSGADDPIAAVIVRVWNDHTVNLQALVDGPDPIWVTSVQHASIAPEGAFKWDWPEIVQNVVPRLNVAERFA